MSINVSIESVYDKVNSHFNRNRQPISIQLGNLVGNTAGNGGGEKPF